MHAKKTNDEKEVNLLRAVVEISTKTRHSLSWGSNRKIVINIAYNIQYD